MTQDQNNLLKLTESESNELLKESSLWALYKLSWKLPFPWACTLPSTLIFLTLIFFSSTVSITNIELVKSIKEISDLGITFTSTILGFLIAGFTIFASLTDRALFIKLAKLKSTDAKLSWLKHIFVVFMHTFVHYTSFLVSLIFIKLVSQPNGIISWIILQYASDPYLTKKYVLIATFSVLSSWLFYLSLLLGRFIFNIYNTVILSIIVAGEDL